MPALDAEVKAEVKKILQRLGKTLSGADGPSRSVVLRCSNEESLRMALGIIPQAYQKITWQDISMASADVAGELQAWLDRSSRGERTIPIFHSFPGELRERALSRSDVAAIEEGARLRELSKAPAIFVVAPPSVRMLVDLAPTFWAEKGAYLAWPNFRETSMPVQPRPAKVAEPQAGPVEIGSVQDVLARMEGDKAGDYLLRMGESLVAKSEHDKAREFLLGAVQIYSRTANLAGLAKTYHILGFSCMMVGDHLTAIEWLAQAIDNWRIADDPAGLAESLAQKGQVHFLRGEMDRAAAGFREALDIDIERGAEASVALGYRRVAMVLERIERYPKAEELLKKALDAEQKLGNEFGAAKTLHHMGRVDMLQKRYEAADKNFLASLEIKERLSDRSGMASTWHEMGNLRMAMGQFSVAIEYFEKAEEVEMDLHDFPGLVATCAQHGLACYEIHKFEDALRSLVRAHHFAQATRSSASQDIITKAREIEELVSIDVYNRVVREATDSVRKLIDASRGEDNRNDT